MREPQRYVFYARRHFPVDPYSQVYVPIYRAPQVARSWLDEMIGSDEFEREGDIIRLPSGITIKCDQLDTVLGAQGDEELPAIDSRRILRFKYGTWEGSTAPKPITTDVPKIEKAKRPDKPDDYVTITELAAQWGIPAMQARAALRASDREKPSYGWAFDPKEVPTIKALCGIK